MHTHMRQLDQREAAPGGSRQLRYLQATACTAWGHRRADHSMRSTAPCSVWWWWELMLLSGSGSTPTTHPVLTLAPPWSTLPHPPHIAAIGGHGGGQEAGQEGQRVQELGPPCSHRAEGARVRVLKPTGLKQQQLAEQAEPKVLKTRSTLDRAIRFRVMGLGLKQHA